MPWHPTVVDSQILAIHVALVPGGDQGEVLLFGGDEHWSAQQEPGGDFRKTRVYDVRTHALISTAIPSPDSDVFCAGHAFTGDGRLLIVGGTKAWSTGHGHDLAFWGHRRCWRYNARERQWVEAAQLLADPNGDGSSGGGRWYPGALTLGSGDVLALFGHVAQDDSRHRNAAPERYSPHANVWTPRPKLATGSATSWRRSSSTSSPKPPTNASSPGPSPATAAPSSSAWTSSATWNWTSAAPSCCSRS